MLDGAVPDEKIKRLSRGMKELSSVSTENRKKYIRFKTERDEELVNVLLEVIGLSRESYVDREET